MEYVIVTGMSGAGKSSTLKFFEDMGYFCIDNLPPSLIPKFIKICDKPSSDITKVALGLDIKGAKFFEEFFLYVNDMKKENKNVNILFLECLDKVLLKRFKETRRTHPLKFDRITLSIAKERELVAEVKKQADYIIDTSYIQARALKQKINEIFMLDKKFNSLMVTILSFGFKYGIPVDADLVFDVRFLPNPFYIDSLKQLTGNQSEVSNYVMKFEESKIFLDKIYDMIEFLIPNYIKEGKNQLVIAIGCTGGKHRSVTLANQIHSKLENSTIIHRDIDKDYKK